jgi:hypothetical protein
MTPDDIIRMAEEADLGHAGMECVGFGGGLCSISTIARFAALVAAAEREACAKVCEEQYEYYGYDHVFAAAIRARGQD